MARQGRASDLSLIDKVRVRHYWAGLAYSGNKKAQSKELKRECRFFKDTHMEKVKKGMKLVKNLSERSITGEAWTPIQSRRFSTVIEKGIVPKELVLALLKWAGSKKSSLSANSFSGADCKNDVSNRIEGPDPSDFKVQMTKLNIHENHENVAVNKLVELVVTRMKANITLFGNANEQYDLMKIFEELIERKKLPMYAVYNLYRKESGAAYAPHRDVYSTFASAVIVLQESGNGLTFPNKPHAESPEVGDICWLNPNDLHEVHPVGNHRNRMAIVVTL